MKTPREILFERHRRTVPRLDAIRRKVLNDFSTSEQAEVDAPGLRTELRIGGLLRKAWRELIWPSRFAWAGMAALWLALVVVNAEMRVKFPTMRRAKSAPASEIVKAFSEQRRWLAELLPPVKAAPMQATRPKLSPRSQGASHG